MSLQVIETSNLKLIGNHVGLSVLFLSWLHTHSDGGISGQGKKV